MLLQQTGKGLLYWDVEGCQHCACRRAIRTGLQEWFSGAFLHLPIVPSVKWAFTDCLSSLPLPLYRLNDPKMSEVERQSMESERADCSLFVQELLLSTLMREESSSSDEDERGEIADFGAMGCVDIMPLDVALENLNLKESNKGNEPPPPPLWWHPTLQTMSSVLYLPMKVDNNYLGFVLVIVISGLSLLLHCVHSEEREKRYIW